jgi:hypothetical protein
VMPDGPLGFQWGKRCHQGPLGGVLSCGNSPGRVGRSALAWPTALCRPRVFKLADYPDDQQ